MQKKITTSIRADPLVSIYRQPKSPFWWGRYRLPPSLRGRFDSSEFPNLRLVPDKHGRVCFSTRETDEPRARALARDIGDRIRLKRQGALKRDVVLSLLADEHIKATSVHELFARAAERDASREQLGRNLHPLDRANLETLQPETLVRRRHHRDNFSTWLASQGLDSALLDQIRSKQLLQFKEWFLVTQQYQRATWNHCRHYLSGLWAWAIDQEWTVLNPWAHKELAVAKPAKRDRGMLTLGQRQILSQAQPTWPVNALLVMMYTGARPSDLVWMHRTHVHFGKAGKLGSVRLVMSKVCRDKPLPMVPFLAGVIKRQLDSHDSEWVFPGGAGQRTRRQYIDKQCNAALHRLLGTAVSAYDLRRTAATLLREAGVPLPTIADLLGHVDWNTSILYMQNTDEALQNAAEKLAAKVSGAG